MQERAVVTAKRVKLTPAQEDDVDLVARDDARQSFWSFRQYTNLALVEGWYQKRVARALYRFYCRLITGQRPKLVLMAPPQHGKSEQVKDFLAWVAGKQPDYKAIFTSYSDELGVATNLALQRLMLSPRYRAVFPGTVLSAVGEDAAEGRRTTKRFDYVGRKGSFRNTTVRGPIRGEGLHIGIIDDPLKSREEAQSRIVRDRTWAWFADDFFSRFDDRAGFIMIMTRVHVDDPVGRLIDNFTGVEVLRFPAVAERTDRFRRQGEALFPQLKSLPFLLERKALLSQASWEAEYQQNPIVVGGGMFPIERFDIVSGIVSTAVKRSVRYWDKAGTRDGGAYTAGVLMHRMADDTYVVADVRRGQWSALERERVIRQTAEIDGGMTTIWVEQEPGSGGKESAEATVRMLSGYSVRADRVSGPKEVRADPYAAQVQGGNVRLLRGEWNMPFIDEHETFPAGKYRDQVDAAGGAFAKLTTGSTYDASLAWVG